MLDLVINLGQLLFNAITSDSGIALVDPALARRTSIVELISGFARLCHAGAPDLWLSIINECVTLLNEELPESASCDPEVIHTLQLLHSVVTKVMINGPALSLDTILATLSGIVPLLGPSLDVVLSPEEAGGKPEAGSSRPGSFEEFMAMMSRQRGQVAGPPSSTVTPKNALKHAVAATAAHCVSALLNYCTSSCMTSADRLLAEVSPVLRRLDDEWHRLDSLVPSQLQGWAVPISLQAVTELIISGTRLRNYLSPVNCSQLFSPVSIMPDSEVSAPSASVLHHDLTAVYLGTAYSVSIKPSATILDLRKAVIRACGMYTASPNDVMLSKCESESAARARPDSKNMDCFPDNGAIAATEGVGNAAILKVTGPQVSPGSNTTFAPSSFDAVFTPSTPFK